ncbi:MAG: hypothetical protein JNL83_18920 [Myxococcales bacterium]|nr:hypothetical protein [Myxococcales bacterium]
MARLLFALLVVTSVGCASSVNAPRTAHPDTWGDRLRAAIPPLDAPDHAQLLYAFEVLAQAIPDIAPGHQAEVDRVRNACTTLARSLGNLAARADFVKIGLTAAAEALDVDGAVVASLDPSKPLRGQYATIRRALLATAASMDGAPAPVTASR